ncbi:MAG: PIN domain-containing protein [Candidatus Lokiarchaeota archaeon]|nr:PIN domain-containing protein [Candidatus Lokiarchaeota archaeon]
MEGNKEIVLDASVILKWFCDEIDSNKALIYKDGYVNREIIILEPDLIIYEIQNVLRYNKGFSIQTVNKALKEFINMDIEIYFPTLKLISIATDLAFNHDISIYDSYYVSLAKMLNCKLITADQKLQKKCSKLKFIEIL